MSYRRLSHYSWVPPENISQTSDRAELLLQVAPILYDDGSPIYTVFISRVYEQGTEVYPPDDLAPTDIYVSAYTFGTIIYSVGGDSEKTSVFQLAQNFPNPFNAQTTLRFEIGDVGYVKLEIFDPLGRTVATLVDEELAPGSYTRSWDVAGVASGVYYYRMLAGGHTETRKLVLIR